MYVSFFFFFNDTATTEIYTLSLHDALPILIVAASLLLIELRETPARCSTRASVPDGRWEPRWAQVPSRSEEHTSELQSRQYLVCRLLLEKKNTNISFPSTNYMHPLHPHVRV